MTVKIPAKRDGSGLDANGNPITNVAGCVHNGFEGGLQQQDTTYDVLDGVSYWGNNVDTWNKKSWTDFITNHTNGTDNLWLRWQKRGADNTCHVIGAVQYAVSKALDLGEYNQLIRWSGDQTCGAGALLLAEDAGGDKAIDSNGDYAVAGG